MAKLNKQEITAVANKIYKELQKNNKLIKARLHHEYIPSSNYLKIQSDLDKIRQLTNNIVELEAKKDELVSNLYLYLSKLGIKRIYWNDYKLAESITNWFEQLIDLESKVTPIPSMEELKDEITIKSIDDSFDINNCIETLINKYSN